MRTVTTTATAPCKAHMCCRFRTRQMRRQFTSPSVQIPTEAGRVFRFEVGHHSDLKPARSGSDPGPFGKAFSAFSLGQQLGHQALVIIHEEHVMLTKRELTMRQIRQILRLAHDGVSTREIARMLGVARSTIQDNVTRAAAAAWVLRERLRSATRCSSRNRRTHGPSRLSSFMIGPHCVLCKALAGRFEQIRRHLQVALGRSDIEVAKEGGELREQSLDVLAGAIPCEHPMHGRRVANVVQPRRSRFVEGAADSGSPVCIGESVDAAIIALDHHPSFIDHLLCGADSPKLRHSFPTSGEFFRKLMKARTV
jgi:hypothetical protein